MSQCQNENEWIETEEGFEYKNIRKNGHWEVIRWRHDVAYYSFCPFCGYMHSCYKIIEMKTEHGVCRYMHQKKNLITVQCVAKIWK